MENLVLLPSTSLECVAKSFGVRFLERSVLLVITDQPIVNVDANDANQFVAVAHHEEALIMCAQTGCEIMSTSFAVPIAAHRHSASLPLGRNAVLTSPLCKVRW